MRYHKRISDATKWNLRDIIFQWAVVDSFSDVFLFLFRVHFTVTTLYLKRLLFYRLYVNCLFALNLNFIFSSHISLLTGALDDGSAAMPDVFVTKYNKFVDGIFERINGILKKSYDPVNVQLNMDGAEMKTPSGTKKSNKK